MNLFQSARELPQGCARRQIDLQSTAPAAEAPHALRLDGSHAQEILEVREVRRELG